MRGRRVGAGAAALAALLLLGSLAAGEIGIRAGRDGVVTAEDAVVRKGDGTAYQKAYIDPVHSGAEFRLREARAGWYRVRLPDGREGWIPSSAAELVAPDAKGG